MCSPADLPALTTGTIVVRMAESFFCTPHCIIGNLSENKHDAPSQLSQPVTAMCAKLQIARIGCHGLGKGKHLHLAVNSSKQCNAAVWGRQK